MDHLQRPPLPREVQQQLDRIGHALAGLGVEPVSIVLFGSAARGEYVPGTSDVDVIVVLPDSVSAAALAAARAVLHEGSAAPPRRGGLERFLKFSVGDAHSTHVCRRADLLSGKAGGMLGLPRVSQPLVSRAVAAGIIGSARTVAGEDLIPKIAVRRIRRLDVIRSFVSLESALLLAIVAFPLLPRANRYAATVLKLSLHNAYTTIHSRPASLDQEVACFTSRNDISPDLQRVLHTRAVPARSFRDLIRTARWTAQLHVLAFRSLSDRQ